MVTSRYLISVLPWHLRMMVSHSMFVQVSLTAKKHGMKIVIDDKLPADLSDMSATLTKFKALKPDILLVSGHSKGAATAARQIEEMKINAPVISITHCEAAKVHVKFPKSANGILCPTQWLTNLPNSEPIFGDAQKYDADFKEGLS